MPAIRTPAFELTLLNTSLFFSHLVLGTNFFLSPQLLSNFFQLDKQEAITISTYLRIGLVCSYIIGGLISDRLTGSKRAAIAGGFLQACGFFLLVTTMQSALYPAIFCMLIGSGLQFTALMSATGRLYASDSHKLDAAFSVNQLVILLSPFIGGLLLAGLAEIKGGKEFITPGILLLLSIVPCFFLSDKPEATEHERTSIPKNQRMKIVAGIIVFGTLYMIFLQLSRLQVTSHLFDNEDKTMLRLGFSRLLTVQAIVPLATTAVVSLLGTIFWRHWKVNPFIKLSVGALLAGAGTIFLVILLNFRQIEYWMLLLIFVLLGIGKALVHIVIPGIITTHAPRRYPGTFIGISWVFFSFVSGYIQSKTVDNSLDFRSSPIPFWGIGLLIIGAAVLILVLTKKNKNYETPIDSEE